MSCTPFSVSAGVEVGWDSTLVLDAANATGALELHTERSPRGIRHAGGPVGGDIVIWMGNGITIVNGSLREVADNTTTDC